MGWTLSNHFTITEHNEKQKEDNVARIMPRKGQLRRARVLEVRLVLLLVSVLPLRWTRSSNLSGIALYYKH